MKRGIPNIYPHTSCRLLSHSLPSTPLAISIFALGPTREQTNGKPRDFLLDLKQTIERGSIRFLLALSAKRSNFRKDEILVPRRPLAPIFLPGQGNSLNQRTKSFIKCKVEKLRVEELSRRGAHCNQQTRQQFFLIKAWPYETKLKKNV